MYSMILAFLVLFLTACVTGGPERTDPEMTVNSTAAGSSDEHGFANLWFKGSVEEAFIAAKEQNKPIFLYWGAVWCPPCNEMKSTVFNQTEFAELMKLAIPVYLDGDSENAQVWGEMFNAAGYPTMIFLTAEKQEIMRISIGVTMAEFSEAFKSVLAQNKPLEQILAAALAGRASQDDYRILAYTSWAQMGYKDWDAAKKLDIAMKLAQNVPSKYVAEKALLQSQLMDVASEIRDSEDKDKVAEALTTVDKQLPELLTSIFSSKKSYVAARGFLVGSAHKVLPWFEEVHGKRSAITFSKKWFTAVHDLANNPAMSIDTRLWTVYPEIKLYELEYLKSAKQTTKGKNKKDEDIQVTYPKYLIKKVEKAVAYADAEAKSDYDRQSVISGASYLLDMVGKKEEGKAMLLKELKTTKSPYYYYSSLAGRAKEVGHKEEALKWATAARESANGRATKLQWISYDLRLSLELSDKENDPRVNQLLDEYYKNLFAVTDGFSGRNKRVAERIVKTFKEPLKKNSAWLDTIKKYAPRCRQIDEKQQDACANHFKELM